MKKAFLIRPSSSFYLWTSISKGSDQHRSFATRGSISGSLARSGSNGHVPAGKESYQSGTLGERSAVLGKASSSSEADASLSEKMKSGKKYTIDRCRQQEEMIKKLRAEVLLLRQLCEKNWMEQVSRFCVQKSARSSNRSRSRRNTTAVFLISAKPPASAATPSTNTAETKRHAGCEFVT